MVESPSKPIASTEFVFFLDFNNLPIFFSNWIKIQIKFSSTVTAMYFPFEGLHNRSAQIFQGPLYLRKHRQPCCWSRGIMPPPFDVSMASNIVTTSSISGRLSGFASQHRFITFARELGQHRGISGLRFCSFHGFFVCEFLSGLFYDIFQPKERFVFWSA